MLWTAPERKEEGAIAQSRDPNMLVPLMFRVDEISDPDSEASETVHEKAGCGTLGFCTNTVTKYTVSGNTGDPDVVRIHRLFTRSVVHFPSRKFSPTTGRGSPREDTTVKPEAGIIVIVPFSKRVFPGTILRVTAWI
jgi:hypothetical protein